LRSLLIIRVAVLASGLLLHQDSSNQRSVGGRQCFFLVFHFLTRFEMKELFTSNQINYSAQ